MRGKNILIRQKDNFQPILKRFITENMWQTSAALAFTTLMSLVPLVTVVVLFSRELPYFDFLFDRLESMIRYSLLPPGTAKIIGETIGNFSDKALGLTWTGLAILSVTAFMLLHTIEKSFNRLWQVSPRPIILRMRLYLVAMAVWPLLLGMLVAAVSFAVTSSFGWFGDLAWAKKSILHLASLLVLWLLFSFCYTVLPNAKVSKIPALQGGLFAAVVFALMKWGFEIFLTQSAVLKSIYGAFIAFPIFLLWLHFSWAALLFGGLIAAQGKNSRAP